MREIKQYLKQNKISLGGEKPNNVLSLVLWQAEVEIELFEDVLPIYLKTLKPFLKVCKGLDEFRRVVNDKVSKDNHFAVGFDKRLNSIVENIAAFEKNIERDIFYPFTFDQGLSMFKEMRVKRDDGIGLRLPNAFAIFTTATEGGIPIISKKVGDALLALLSHLQTSINYQVARSAERNLTGPSAEKVFRVCDDDERRKICSRWGDDPLL